MDKDRNSAKRTIFMKKARDFFNKQIEKEEDKLERELTKEEKKENRKKNRKLARFIATVAISSFAFGGLVGGVGERLLNSGNTIKVVEDQNKNEITIDVGEIDEDKDINIKNSTRRLSLDGLRIGEDELEAAKNIQELIHNVCLEVNKLEEPEQIETYIKTLYANNYNKTNGTNITGDDITIHREKAEEYKAILEDDDEKSNRIENSPYKKILEQGINVITVTVNKEGNKEETKLAYVENRRNYVKAPIYFASIYEKGQETLENLLPVIDIGLDWKETGVKNGATKEAFIDSVIQYKKFKMNEIATESIELDDENEERSLTTLKKGDKIELLIDEER